MPGVKKIIEEFQDYGANVNMCKVLSQRFYNLFLNVVLYKCQGHMFLPQLKLVL